MKFFSPAWHSGHLSEDEASRVATEYEAHISRLDPPLSASARRLGREVSLHDALLRTLSHEHDRLELSFRAGDRQAGYFDARLRYAGAELTPDHKQFLGSIIGNRDVELLYDEFDAAGDGRHWVHRLLFWPYHEVSIQFGAFDFELVPAAARFDDGQDGD